MKITSEHYSYLRERIAQIPADSIAAHRANLLNDPRVKDLDMRLRWDVLWSVVPSRWVCDNIYPYANDSNLDTALRSIMREVS